MGVVKQRYPSVFGDEGGGAKPHSREYQRFGEAFGWYRILVEAFCDSKVEKIKEAYQLNLLDSLEFLVYRLEKAKADEAEDKFQENLRKAKRGR